MKFSETALPGVFLVDIEPREDERGFFARLWCRDELARHGLSTDLAQISLSFNRRKGTLRGMHYQSAPHEEVKLVRCTLGAIYDVLVDLRRGSPTFRRWISAELTAENRRTLYVPKGVAHGFQTLEDGSEVLYQISEFHHPESARGARWNDPAFGIEWPDRSPILSKRDENYPDFRE
ncbi:MAG TPA: dTDP-4-dehydrorhamnose 3,5-epimerase [Thermoanaerobaculia bacterium]|nr:dTDP-4-dehydrorhamnose 3,5-epimerase [Thermoanaerobaculia bacterium]